MSLKNRNKVIIRQKQKQNGKNGLAADYILVITPLLNQLSLK